MKLTIARRLVVIVGALMAVVAAPTSAHAFVADDSFDQYGTGGARIAGSADYLTARSLDLVAYIKDRPGDAYCTIVEAELWANDSRGYRKLGNTITLGSVCNGNGVTLPVKRLSTQAGDIFELRVQARRGSGGPWATNMAICRVASDGSENCR